jgi:general secretion pathway protein L
MSKQRCNQQGQVTVRIPPSSTDPWLWHYQPDQGDAQTGFISATAPKHNLPQAANNAVMTLLLPAGRFLFRHIQFEGKLRGHAVQPLLWQLEEFALCEVEDLHLAVLHQQDNNYYLAAVEKSLLRNWLAQLTAWGLQPQRALPDVLALPCAHAVKLEDEWLIRHNEYGGFSATEDELLLLQLFPDIFCHGPRPAGMVLWREGVRQDPLALLAKGVQHNHCNLLQGEFALQPPRTCAKRPPLLAALAICYLLSFFLEPLWLGWQAQRQTENLRQQANELYQHYFKSAPLPANPRQQLERYFAKSGTTLAQPNLLSMLAQARTLLNSLPPGEPQALDWDGKQLTLTLHTQEERLQTLLNKHPLMQLSMWTEPGADLTTRLILEGKKHDPDA